MAIQSRSVLEFFLREVRRPLSFREIADLLAIPTEGRRELREQLRELTAAGDLVRIKGGRFGLPRKMNLVVGLLRCSPKGYGFVVPEKANAPDVFVRLPDMGGALHGDRVVARVERRKPDGRVSGSVIRVLDHANRRILGRFLVGAAGYAFVSPLEAKVLTEVLIPQNEQGGAVEGQIVEIEVTEFPGRQRETVGRVVAVIGAAEDPEIDLELVLRRHELPRGFPTAVLDAATSIPESVPTAVASARRDFRDGLVVTIDGAKARDFDDAVSVRRSGSGWQLDVHIADVSHYVAPGSVIDREAYERGTSVYFPDHVIPMLPESLSNGICSLRPGVDRLTLSLSAELDARGEVTSYAFYDGVIRSRARMTYDEVHAILVDGEPTLLAQHRDLVPMFRDMRELADIIGSRRRDRGSLDFDVPEGEVVIDEQGEMTGIRRGRRLISHGIIEEFMILANEVVARHFVENDLPFLYRIHEPPDPADVEVLNRTLGPFGFSVDALSPKSFRAVLDAVRDKPEERFVNTVSLRTMRLARYDIANIGHYGLASTAYTHFTSPIRRYPDLIVHRLLRAWMAMSSAMLSGERDTMRQDLEGVALESSRLARRAEDAEREYVERKKARFMLDKVGEEFEAVITAVESFGFFVELQEYFVEGLVHLTSLPDDFYIHDQDAHRLTGEYTGRVFRIGDALRVRVVHVDLLRRKIDFTVVEAEKVETSPKPRLSPRRGRRRSGGD